MGDVIRGTLGTNFTADDTNFGVFKSVQGARMLLQLGSPLLLPFNVTLAEVQWPLYGFNASACTWANPLLATPLPPDPPSNPALGML